MVKNIWVNRWAGSYTFISCSFWAKQYRESLDKILGKSLDNPLFVHKKGTVSFYLKKQELDSIGKFLVDKTLEDESYGLRMLQKLKDNTDVIMGLMEDFEGKILTFEDYSLFLEAFEKHLGYHDYMKKTVDYLAEQGINLTEIIQYELAEIKITDENA